jgi:hypothetical protein
LNKLAPFVKNEIRSKNSLWWLERNSQIHPSNYSLCSQERKIVLGTQLLIEIGDKAESLDVRGVDTLSGSDMFWYRLQRTNPTPILMEITK